MAPDEPAHFFRAYQVSEFGFYPEVKDDLLGGQLPVSLWKAVMDFGVEINKSFYSRVDSWIITKYFFIDLNPDERIFMMFPNTSLYSPFLMLPQAAGIFAGRIMHLPPLFILYLGRLFNLAFWIVVIFFSIKLMLLING